VLLDDDGAVERNEMLLDDDGEVEQNEVERNKFFSPACSG